MSQRGHIVARLEVDTGGSDVHPGRLGGAVLDPGLLLAEALLRLRDELLPELGIHPEDSLDVQPDTRTDAAVARAARGRAMTGKGLDHRVTRHGALGITRLVSGGRGGAIPSRSTARIDLRLPPRVDPADARSRANRLLADLAPRGATVRLRVLASTPGLETTPDTDTRRATEEACRTGFGRLPVYVPFRRHRVCGEPLRMGNPVGIVDWEHEAASRT